MKGNGFKPLKDRLQDGQELMIVVSELNESISETITHMMKFAEASSKVDNVLSNEMLLSSEGIRLMGNLMLLKTALEGVKF